MRKIPMFTEDKNNKHAVPAINQEEWNIRYDILKHSLWIFAKCLLCLDVFWYIVLVGGGYAPIFTTLKEIAIAPAVLLLSAGAFQACYGYFKLPLSDYTIQILLNVAVTLIITSDRWTHSLQAVCILPMIFGLIIGNPRLIDLQVAISAAMMIVQFLAIEMESTAQWKGSMLLNLSGIVFDIVLMARLILQIRKYTQMLNTQTTIDSLTRLFNHEAFYTELDKQLSEFQEAAKPLSILIADIDNFKKVNDTFGHAYGDKVLRVLAGIFSEESSDKCFVARYGGEEFAMIMELNQSDAITKAETIRKCFEQKKIPTENGVINSFTISIGIAFYHPKYKTSSQFFQKADEALYKAKAGGKNRVCV